MITNKEITSVYLAYKGKIRGPGVEDNVVPLMPFYIMDTAYQIYCKDIKDIKCGHLLKKAKTRMADGFHKFSMDFFLAFNVDQRDYICDQMDEFNDYIHNTVVMLKSSVMESFVSTAPFGEKKALASLLACNVLAQSAQHLHRDMYRNARLRGETNKYIEDVKRGSYEFACHYPVSEGVDITSSDKVMAMIDVLCRKIVQFLKEKDDETQT